MAFIGKEGEKDAPLTASPEAKTISCGNGCVTGIISGSIMGGLGNPIDKAMTLLQRPDNKLSIAQALTKNPFKGIGLSLGQQVASNVILFNGLTYYKDRLTALLGEGCAASYGAPLLASLTQAAIMNPVSVVKNIYHSQAAKQSLADIVKAQTFKSLSSGIGLTSLRNGIFLAITLGCDKSDEAQSMAYGLMKGMLATVLTFPIDTVKKEVQRSGAKLLPTIERVMKSEKGVLALYQGYSLNMPRMGLATAALVFAQHASTALEGHTFKSSIDIDDEGRRIFERIDTCYLV